MIETQPYQPFKDFETLLVAIVDYVFTGSLAEVSEDVSADDPLFNLIADWYENLGNPEWDSSITITGNELKNVAERLIEVRDRFPYYEYAISVRVCDYMLMCYRAKEDCRIYLDE